MATHTDTDRAPAPAPRLCGCGCGEAVARRYRPGHDARHKSMLVAALADPRWQVARTAADTLADAAWDGFAPAAALRSVAWRASNGLAKQHVADVATWQVSADGQHHAHRRCPALTAHARRTGTANPITRLASDASLAMVANTPDLAARLTRSWDQCTTCSHDAHRDEVAEANGVGRAILAIVSDPTPRTPRKTPPTTWSFATESGGMAHAKRDPLTTKVTITWPTVWAPPALIA